MFNPKKSFFELPVVRWAIGIHVVIASASALAILITGDYGFSPTADGFNRFLTDFKFPIGVLAMLIPVVALLATNHRSEQTREQIRVAESQNTFSNHYKHIEEFEKYAERYAEQFENVKISNIRDLYAELFPASSVGKLSVSREYLGKVLESSVDLMVCVRALALSDEPDREKAAYKICHLYNENVSKKSYFDQSGVLSRLQLAGSGLDEKVFMIDGRLDPQIVGLTEHLYFIYKCFGFEGGLNKYTSQYEICIKALYEMDFDRLDYLNGYYLEEELPAELRSDVNIPIDVLIPNDSLLID